MKKFILTIVFGLSLTAIHAQDITDALRLAQNNLSGTARFRGMSGAFGALGGDLSAVNINPAGSVVFANNQASVTLGNFNTSNESSYFGTKSKESDHSFDINQVGGVFVFENNGDFWNKFAISINYENELLNNDSFTAGINPFNSIDKYFLYYANGLQRQDIDGSYYYFDELYFGEQQAYLGYNSYIIDANSSFNTETGYHTNISNLGNYNQQNSLISKGYNGKLSFNGSAQVTDKFSIGLTLNSHFTDFRQNQQFTETNSNPKYALGSTVDYVRFDNEIYTFGTGFSFQLGTIIKPTKQLRLGASFESPTWYHLNDETTQSIATRGFGLNSTLNNNVYNSVSVDPSVINTYDPYTLRTPAKLTGSFAYIFGKKGLFSIDYAKKFYGMTEFGPEDQFSNSYNRTNIDIQEMLVNSTEEVRLGAEIKAKKWSIRGGYRFEGSPYNDKKIMSDLKGFSTGLGYNFGGTKLDLSYSRAERSRQQTLVNKGLLDAATINSVFNNITATVTFEF